MALLSYVLHIFLDISINFVDHLEMSVVETYFKGVNFGFWGWVTDNLSKDDNAGRGRVQGNPSSDKRESSNNWGDMPKMIDGVS